MAEGARPPLRLSTLKLRVMYLTLLVQPLLLPLYSSLVEFGRQGRPPAGWLGTARFLAATFGTYMLLGPFVCEWVYRKSAERVREKGYDPSEMALLIGLAGSIQPVMMSFLLVLIGESAKWAYIAALISLVSEGHWCWRYRAVLRRVYSSSANSKRLGM